MLFGNKTLSFDQAHIMGVINVTPDSMSDGGRFMREGQVNASAVYSAVDEMLVGGATFIDIGGESTRPRFDSVSEMSELDRVVPIIEGITQRFDTIVSVDTSKAAVMAEAIKVGALLINDVQALTSEGALTCCAQFDVPVVLMHSFGALGDLHDGIKGEDMMCQINQFFAGRIQACQAAGINEARLILDPGFGFGKKVEENITLMQGLKGLQSFGMPVLAGLSRKKTISTILGGREPAERLAGGLALAVLAFQQGARIIRTHNVKETSDAIKIAAAFDSANIA